MEKETKILLVIAGIAGAIGLYCLLTRRSKEEEFIECVRAQEFCPTLMRLLKNPETGEIRRFSGCECLCADILGFTEPAEILVDKGLVYEPMEAIEIEAEIYDRRS